MTAFIAANAVPVAIAAFLAGLILGLVHFASLRRVSTGYLTGASVGRTLAFQLARLAALALALTALALAGAIPLLAGTAGLFAGRTAILRRERGAG